MFPMLAPIYECVLIVLFAVMRSAISSSFHLSIAKKTADLNALFMDVAQLVEEQQKGIDDVVDNTETADSMTKEGLGQLEQAHRTQRTTGKVFCYFSVFLIIIAGGVVGAMILMKKV